MSWKELAFRLRTGPLQVTKEGIESWSIAAFQTHQRRLSRRYDECDTNLGGFPRIHILACQRLVDISRANQQISWAIAPCVVAECPRTGLRYLLQHRLDKIKRKRALKRAEGVENHNLHKSAKQVDDVVMDEYSKDCPLQSQAFALRLDPARQAIPWNTLLDKRIHALNARDKTTSL